MRVILPLAFLLLSASGGPVLASTEVFFSPGVETKVRIIKSIKEARESIDVAIFKFTSADIAKAILEAKKRGVRIRLLVDLLESQKDPSLINFLKDEDIEVKYLRGQLGGRMHYSFAIFDSKELLTGSYSWTESAEKFNLENALFTDETRLVSKYQLQFDKLFGERRVATGPAEELTREFLGLTLAHLNRLLGEGSALSQAEKDVVWGHCKEKYITGEAEVIYLSTGSKVGIKDETGVEIELALDRPEAEKIQHLKPGQKVNYTGRLASMPKKPDKSFKLDKGSVKKGSKD